MAVVSSAALMVPAASAFAEAPQNTAKVASNQEQALKQFNNQKEWISQDTIIIKHSGLAKNVHKKNWLKSDPLYPFIRLRCYPT